MPLRQGYWYYKQGWTISLLCSKQWRREFRQISNAFLLSTKPTATSLFLSRNSSCPFFFFSFFFSVSLISSLLCFFLLSLKLITRRYQKGYKRHTRLYFLSILLGTLIMACLSYSYKDACALISDWQWKTSLWLYLLQNKVSCKAYYYGNYFWKYLVQLVITRNQ